MAELVTVRLPEDALKEFRRSAEAAGKSLEEFLADRLVEVVPPSTEHLSAALRDELAGLERMDDSQLAKLFASTFVGAKTVLLSSESRLSEEPQSARST